jgi:hypothetical protein
LGWGASRRTAVYVPYSACATAWSGERGAFIVEGFIKKVAGSSAACISRLVGGILLTDKTIYRRVRSFKTAFCVLSEIKHLPCL